jgi:tetratricopeptide (TPR) repeat protein
MAEEANPRICPSCGTAIPEGETECPRCGSRWTLLLHSRETVLSGCALFLIICFFITGMIVGDYHQKVRSLGDQWFAKGREELQKKNVSAALADFRDSLVYNPDNMQVQFQLAEALSEEGRDEEAQSYLVGLLAQTPSDGPVNLALARIAAKRGAEADALRYYQGAIYGIWPSNGEGNRLGARLELCRFLVAQNDASTADSELIGLEGEIPRRGSAVLHEQTAELFLRAGDISRALEEFRRALEEAHPPAAAWRGAGITAYETGDYRAAERYLERAEREKTTDPQAAAALDTTRLILAWDPNARGLPDSQRRERVRHDLAQAISRVEACAKSNGVDLSQAEAQTAAQGKTAGAGKQGSSQPNGDLAAQYARAKDLQAGLSNRDLDRHPERMDEAINAIFELEATATQKCGEPTGLDEALEILSKNRQNGMP